MTLSIIDMRLKVFPQYLEYRIDRGVSLLSKGQKLQYKLQMPMSFDAWLYCNNHQDLIL